MIMISEGFFLNVLLKKIGFFIDFVSLKVQLLKTKNEKNKGFSLENFQIKKLNFLCDFSQSFPIKKPRFFS